VRPVLIVCETKHVVRANEGVRRLCHPQLLRAPDAWTRVFGVDLALEIDQQQAALVALTIQPLPRGASNKLLVLASKETVLPMKLKALAAALSFELQVTTGKVLTKYEDPNGPSELAKLLGSAGLSLRGASCAMLKGWMHGLIDRQRVDNWIGQFGQLGKYGWIGEAILGEVLMIDQSFPGDRLAAYADDPALALSVNVDPKGVFKSAEIIANLLSKRHNGRTVYRWPAEAIEVGKSDRLMLFEDGLWSGTEAVGVIRSLLGQRNHNPKTKVLDDPARLSAVDLTLVYGVATDYGQALVRRYLSDQRLTNIRISAVDVLPVADSDLLRDLTDPTFDPETLYREGPDAGRLRPHLFAALEHRGVPTKALEEMHEFCSGVGYQLFKNYLDRQRVVANWDPWPETKLGKAALGYHGLAFTHAFGHSVPKASLPLLWSRGPVEWKGRTVTWKPLFDNA